MSSKSSDRALFWIELITLGAVLALGVYLRFYNLDQYPGWYSDEGSFINFTGNLMQGNWQLFGIQRSPLVIGRLPLFFYLLAGVFRFTGVGLHGLRVLTASLGVASILLTYLIARPIVGGGRSLLAAALLAIMPWAVFFSRIGFTYNLLTIFVLITIYTAWRFSETKRVIWGIGACLVAGLAFSSDHLGVIMLVVVFSMFLWLRPRWFPGAMAAGLFPAVALLVPAWMQDPQAFMADTGYWSGNLGLPLPAQVVNIVLYVGELFRREAWLALAIAGLVLLPVRRARNLVLMVVGLTMLLVVRTFAPVGRNFHYFIQIIPLFCLGLAVFIAQASEFLLTLVRTEVASALDSVFSRSASTLAGLVGRISASIVTLFLVGIPLIWFLIVDLGEIFSGGGLRYFAGEDFSVTPAADARAAIAYLSSQVNPEDLVVASPQLTWAIPAFKADYYQVLAAERSGQPVVTSIAPENFAYPSSLLDVDFALIDPLAADWAAAWTPGLAQMIAEVRTWPLQFETNSIQIYCNPARCP